MTAKDGNTIDLDEFDELDELTDDEDENVLRLSDLAPSEAIRFEVTDGKFIDFADASNFSPKEYARLSKLGKLIEKNTDVLEKHPDDDNTAQRLDRYMGAFMQMILPDMTEAQISEYSYGKKSQIIIWWSNKSNFLGDAKKGNRQGRER